MNTAKIWYEAKILRLEIHIWKLTTDSFINTSLYMTHSNIRFTRSSLSSWEAPDLSFLHLEGQIYYKKIKNKYVFQKSLSNSFPKTKFVRKFIWNLFKRLVVIQTTLKPHLMNLPQLKQPLKLKQSANLCG